MIAFRIDGAVRIILLLAAFTALAALSIIGLHVERLWNRGDLFFFLPLPLILLYGIGWIWRRDSAQRALAAAMLLAIGGGVWGAEAFLRWESLSSIERAPKVVGADTRTRHQVVMDLNATGYDAFPALFPAYSLKTQADGTLRSPFNIDGREILPLGSVANALNVLCNEDGRWIIYKSDEAGFPNPKGIWSLSKIDVALIGDSYTQGYCVDPNSPQNKLMEDIHAKVLQIGASAHVEIIDLRPTFLAHVDKPSLFAVRQPNHYSESGHNLVAEAVLKSLMAKP